LLAVNGAAVQRKPGFAKSRIAHMTPALFVEEDTRLEIALRRMQRAGQRMAIVLARDGHEIGIVTLEDILKLMFGEVKL
jgi:CBS domain containing-hemolysin-like protein